MYHDLCYGCPCEARMLNIIPLAHSFVCLFVSSFLVKKTTPVFDSGAYYVHSLAVHLKDTCGYLLNFMIKQRV